MKGYDVRAYAYNAAIVCEPCGNRIWRESIARDRCDHGLPQTRRSPCEDTNCTPYPIFDYDEWYGDEACDICGEVIE